MPRSKPSVRTIRRHPAVITEPVDLQEGMEVAVGYFVEPITRKTRCGQALLGLVAPPTGVEKHFEGMKAGYAHTPAWGMVLKHVAEVNWINSTNYMHKYPYASLRVTQSTIDTNFSDRPNSVYLTSFDQLEDGIRDMPEVTGFDTRGEPTSDFELIAGFQDMGLAPQDRLHYLHFTVDLAKLSD